MKEKVPASYWKFLSLGDKGAVYFEHLRVSLEAQTRFHNDWKAAFQWFEQSQVDWAN